MVREPGAVIIVFSCGKNPVRYDEIGKGKSGMKKAQGNNMDLPGKRIGTLVFQAAGNRKLKLKN